MTSRRPYRVDRNHPRRARYPAGNALSNSGLFMLAVPLVAATSLLTPGSALAGPPFLTDDPEPVEYRHTELYLFSQLTHVRDDTSGTLAGIEANYGLLPDVQIHLIAPLAFDATNGQSSHYGYGDTEIGAKYRFVHENKNGWWPQIGIFPLIELPTGKSRLNLGGGYTREFLPVWLQKDFGDWRTYGGGGYWHNPGAGNRNYWFFGWLLQRKITEKLTLGGEVFHQTASKIDGRNSSGFNLGGIYDLSEAYHILFSAGRGLQNAVDSNQFSGYLALQLTY